MLGISFIQSWLKFFAEILSRKFGKFLTEERCHWELRNYLFLEQTWDGLTTLPCLVLSPCSSFWFLDLFYVVNGLVFLMLNTYNYCSVKKIKHTMEAETRDWRVRVTTAVRAAGKGKQVTGQALVPCGAQKQSTEYSSLVIICWELNRSKSNLLYCKSLQRY